MTHKTRTTKPPSRRRVAFRQFKLYCKLVAVGAVVVLILVTLIYNRDNEADVWFFKTYKEVNVINLMLATALGAIVGFWVLSHSFKIYREWRQVGKDKAAQQREQRLVHRERQVREQEQRLSEQLRTTEPVPTDDDQDSGS